MSELPAGFTAHAVDPSVAVEPSVAVGPVAVEVADVGDALATFALYREILAENRWLVSYPDEPQHTLEERQQELEHAATATNAFFLVGRHPDQRIAGYISVIGGTRERTRHVASFELLVAAAFRRQGIGRALLNEALRRARRTGVLRKLTAAVFADNAPGIGLLRSVGFVDEGRRIGQYQERDGRLRGDLLLGKFV